MTNTDPTPARFGWRKLLPLAVLLVGAIAGVVFLRDTLSLDALREHQATLQVFRQTHPIAVPLAFIAIYVAIVAFSLPGALIATLTGGFLFGLFPGVLFNVLGASLGSVAIFYAVRLGLGEALRSRIDASDGAVKRLSDGLRDNQISVLLTMRLIPVVPFFIANLIPAFLGISLWRFFWTTLLGILPGSAVYTWVGAGLGEVFARGETPHLGLIFEPHVLGPLLALAALALSPILIKILRSR